MDAIEFKRLSASNGDSWLGYFEGLRVVDILEVGYGDYIVSFNGKTFSPHQTLEAAKAKAEELFSEWLQKTNLIPLDQIHFCDKCGDSGLLPEDSGCDECSHCTVDNMLEGDFCQPTCDCREIPYSFWSIKERAKR